MWHIPIIIRSECLVVLWYYFAAVLVHSNLLTQQLLNKDQFTWAFKSLSHIISKGSKSFLLLFCQDRREESWWNSVGTILSKAKPSVTECGHHADGWPLHSRLCTRSMTSLGSNPLHSTKGPLGESDHINRGLHVPMCELVWPSSEALGW